MSCPVTIHKITDTSPFAGTNGEKPQCPVVHLDIDDISDSPSVQEYKRLRRIMGMITKFYRDGSNKKKENWESVRDELEKLEFDQSMTQAQLNALNQPSFRSHPKQIEYRTALNEEMEGRNKEKEKYLVKQKEFFDLYEWSKGIVTVCEWLEMSIDDYCKKMELPERIKKHIKTPPELKPEQISTFSTGLDEITHNLAESQDFFQASIDGRLIKYHGIEKKLIEDQLEAVRRFSEDAPRRQYIEAELLKDLEYVESNMVDTPESINRKEKMLSNHQEFLAVLKFTREKLHLLPTPASQQYDSKYDHYKD